MNTATGEPLIVFTYARVWMERDNAFLSTEPRVIGMKIKL